MAQKKPFLVKLPLNDKIFEANFDISPHDLSENLIVGHLTRMSTGEHFLMIGQIEKVAFASEEAIAVRWPKACYVAPICHKNQKQSTFTFCFSPTEIDCIFTPL